jgi:hypothetical protein
MMLGFLRSLLIKACFLGITLAVVKYGPNMYTKYVGPLPPALQEAQKYTDFDQAYKVFHDVAKKMGN